MQGGVHVLHVSDTHLGYRQYGLYEREKDIYRVFEEVIDKALAEHVDMVVHAGDFFDTVRPPPQAILAAIENLRRLRDRGVPFVVIMGDHDTPKRRITPPLIILERLGLVKLIGLTPETLKTVVRTKSGEVLVAGLHNYRRVEAAKLRAMLARLVLRGGNDKPSILMLHQCVRGVCPQYEVDTAQIPPGYSYYAAGHLHVYRELRVNGRPFVYPGAVEYMRADEVSGADGRFVVLAEVGTSGAVVQKLRLERVRPQFRVELHEENLKEQLARLLSRLRRLSAGGMKPLVHITVKGSEHSRKRIIAVIEQGLRGLVLSYRLRYESTNPLTPGGEAAIPSTLNRLELLKSLLKDERLARLADELIEVLSITGQNPVDEAIKLIDKIYGISGGAE